MKNILILILIAFVFGCEDDDGEAVRHGGDARFVDVKAPAEDSGASDASELDIELPVADGILPPLDMVLPVADSMMVDMEEPVVDAETPVVIPASDAGAESVDGGEISVDASLSDM